MPFNLKSRRPPDISNNNATDITVGWVVRGAVRGPFNSVQKAIYENTATAFENAVWCWMGWMGSAKKI